MRCKQTHTSFKQGTTIMVITRDGQRIKTKFKQKRGRYIETEAGNFANADLRSVSYYKHPAPPQGAAAPQPAKDGQ